MKNQKIKFEGLPQRLDVFITQAENGLSREFAKRMINDGLALVNGKARKPSFLLSPGDEITLTTPVQEGPLQDLNSIILHEDKHLLAVAKPSGLCVHPTDSNWERLPEACLMGEETLVSMLFKSRPELMEGGTLRLGLVHRLDRDTSGIMLIAKDEETQSKLQDQFRERLVEKIYIGAVCGVPSQKTGSIDAPIGRASGFKKIKVWEYGRDALTDFKVVEKGAKFALLEVYPRTGRTNQIRIHLSFIGHPIAGDKLYGGHTASRLMLHSLSASFKHPATGKKMTLTAPPPEEFTAEWKRLKGLK